jgi:ATP-dependent metalloprotease
VPSDSETSMNKAEILSQIDVAMGGHVAEKLIVGNDQITSGCGSDLQGATNMATAAVRQYGMFGDDLGFSTIAVD